MSNAIFSWHGVSWSLHLGVPRCWGWVWGYSPGDQYCWAIREIGLGPLFVFVWEGA